MPWELLLLHHCQASTSLFCHEIIQCHFGPSPKPQTLKLVFTKFTDGNRNELAIKVLSLTLHFQQSQITAYISFSATIQITGNRLSPTCCTVYTDLYGLVLFKVIFTGQRSYHIVIVVTLQGPVFLVDSSAYQSKDAWLETCREI